MSFVSFYKKYRPNKFTEIIGQKHLTKTLMNEVKDNKLSSVYIFSGPKGNGKTSNARIFAKAINCLNNKNGDACGECENCKSIQEGNCLDIIELDAATNNGVGQIREIVKNTFFLPTILKKKIYIVDEAHMITNEAWNALLKTLEDTPEHVIFIFATTEFHKIPATIVSRSQYFNLSKLNDEEMNSVLSNVVEKEKINISNDASKQLIELANGHARDLLSMLEQMYMVSNNNINTELIYSMFGIVAIDKKIKLINLIIENNLAECLNLAESFIQSGANIYLLTLDICDILIDKLVYIQTKNQKLLKKINLKEFDSINSSQYKYLLNLLNIFEKELGKVKTSNEAYFYFKKMIFESLAICDTQNNNSVNIIETKENIKEEKVLKNTKDSNLNKIITNLEHSFTLEGMFSTKEYKNNKSDIHESVNQESKNQEKPNIFNEIKQDSKNEKEKNVKRDLEKIFLQVAFNYSKENNAKMQSNLQKMIESNLAAFANIGDCERVFISSNNAVIIKFNNTIDAELFNEYSLRQKFMDAYKKMFNQESVFIGLDNKKIDEFKIKFQEFKKKNNPLPDVNLSEFLSNDIISKAFDEFLR